MLGIDRGDCLHKVEGRTYYSSAASFIYITIRVEECRSERERIVVYNTEELSFVQTFSKKVYIYM